MSFSSQGARFLARRSAAVEPGNYDHRALDGRSGAWPHRAPMIPNAPAVADIAHTIQLAVAPVFLLAGIGQFLNVLIGRLNRVVDRARLLAAEFTPVSHPKHALQVWELRLLDRRILLASIATYLCAASAVLVSLVVAGLFIAELAHLKFGNIMALGFILAMILLIAGLIFFLFEVQIAYRGIKVSEEFLERRK
jgi:hypothetical protein